MDNREKRLRSGVFLPEDYRFYITSEHFLNLRKRTGMVYREKCQICRRKTGQKGVVHHWRRGYKKLFMERVGVDVTWFCKRCHIDWHRKNSKRWNQIRKNENIKSLLYVKGFKMNTKGELSKDDLVQSLGNFDDRLKALERKIVPSGEYNLLFKDWIPRRTATGDTRVVAQLEVVDSSDPELNGAQVFNSCPISGKGEVFLTRMLVAYGITWTDGDYNIRDGLDACIGKIAVAIVEPNEYGEEGNKKTSNNITKWISGEEVLMQR